MTPSLGHGVTHFQKDCIGIHTAEFACPKDFCYNTLPYQDGNSEPNSLMKLFFSEGIAIPPLASSRIQSQIHFTKHALHGRPDLLRARTSRSIYYCSAEGCFGILKNSNFLQRLSYFLPPSPPPPCPPPPLCPPPPARAPPPPCEASECCGADRCCCGLACCGLATSRCCCLT